MAAEKSGEESATPPPRFRVLSDPYGNVALADGGRKDTFHGSREAALILAVNRLAQELAELKKATSK